MTATDLDVPVHADDEKTRWFELPGDEVEQRERSGIGGVQILEHEHERLALSGAPQERGDRVQKTETGLPRVRKPPRRLDVAEQLA